MASIRQKNLLFIMFWCIGILLMFFSQAEGYRCSSEPTDDLIKYGDTVTCKIEPVGDIDKFRFQGSNGDQIVLQASYQSGAATGPCIELFDPDGELVGTKCGGSFAGIDTDLGKTGEYTILVTENGNNNAMGYGLSYQCVGDCPNIPVTFLYTPVTPCRIVDTRKAGGAIPAGGIRSYNVRGAVASQGGNPAGCPSPKGEPRAVHINVTSVPLGNGWITAYPFGSAAPLASLVNYRSDAQNVANSGTVKTCYICGKDISIKSGGDTTHVIIDVWGYYYAP